MEPLVIGICTSNGVVVSKEISEVDVNFSITAEYHNKPLLFLDNVECKFLSNCEETSKFLKRRFTNDMTTEDGIFTTLLAMREKHVNEMQIKILLGSNEIVILTESEIRNYLDEME